MGMLKSHVQLVFLVRMENTVSIAALQSNLLAMSFLTATMESSRGVASYLVSSMSFGEDHLGRYSLSNF